MNACHKTCVIIRVLLGHLGLMKTCSKIYETGYATSLLLLCVERVSLLLSCLFTSTSQPLFVSSRDAPPQDKAGYRFPELTPAHVTDMVLLKQTFTNTNTSFKANFTSIIHAFKVYSPADFGCFGKKRGSRVA